MQALGMVKISKKQKPVWIYMAAFSEAYNTL